MKYEDELHSRIREVLHYIWDPIGVRGEPNARDEYDSYAPHVYTLIQNGATAEQIADHLEKIATERMGLNSNKEHSLITAHTLLDWRAILLRKRPEILG
jgi:hypothetical protein